MEIRITYVCDGAIYCGFKPEGVTVIEERQVLYPDEGYEFERKSDGEHLACIWLKDGDVQDNYIEIKLKGEDNESSSN